VIPHNRLTYDQREEEEVLSTIRSGYWAGGPKVKALEEALKKKLDRTYAFGVGSGVGGLRIALLSVGVSENDEVILPGYCCVALTNAILNIGAIPVPVDVSASDWNIYFESVQQKITSKTKAIIAVNTFGAPADIAALKKFNLPVIEDCAHGFGENGMGAQGDVSVLSLYASKFIGCGEGGVVLTNNKNYAEQIEDYRDYADKLPDKNKLNDKMNDLEASIALVQLSKVDLFIDKRRAVAQKYNEALRGESKLILPAYSSNRIWYRYVLSFKNVEAKKLIDLFKAEGVKTDAPVEDWRTDVYRQEPMINTDRAYNSLLSVPIYPSLSKEEQDIVIQSIKNVLKKI